MIISIDHKFTIELTYSELETLYNVMDFYWKNDSVTSEDITEELCEMYKLIKAVKERYEVNN